MYIFFIQPSPHPFFPPGSTSGCLSNTVDRAEGEKSSAFGTQAFLLQVSMVKYCLLLFGPMQLSVHCCFVRGSVRHVSRDDLPSHSYLARMILLVLLLQIRGELSKHFKYTELCDGLSRVHTQNDLCFRHRLLRDKSLKLARTQSSQCRPKFCINILSII